MNTSGSSAIAIHWPSACRKRGGSLAKDGGLYDSNTPSLDAGGERLDRAAEQHVDARVVLLGDDARERLARREAHEVDLDAGRLLELLEHRPRPVLGPDRIDVERFRGGGEARPRTWRWPLRRRQRHRKPARAKPHHSSLDLRAVRDRPRRRSGHVVLDRVVLERAQDGRVSCSSPKFDVADRRDAGDRHGRADPRSEHAEAPFVVRHRRVHRERRVVPPVVVPAKPAFPFRDAATSRPSRPPSGRSR